MTSEIKEKFIVAGFSKRAQSWVYIIRGEKTARENYENNKNHEDFSHIILGKVLEESKE